MHTIRKSLILLLCALLSASAVTGCSSEQTENYESMPDTETVTETTPETDYLETLSVKDLNGEVYHFIAQNGGRAWNFSDDALTGETINDALYQRNTQIQEQYNVVL